eukprot:TRINITY_DN3578_c0_g1_i2.p1 TRINITY_DN3578_c0_g1~~TRINITY_DN3578_c0_g1_i2.p1  ORF type:complete len:113 (-),score=23.29 TRINITY_DN3578_c0_g1_i2:35-373(-)
MSKWWFCPQGVGGGGGECLAGGKMKTSFGFLPVPKSNISAGLQRLIKTIKSFSQMFVYKEEVGEMEIGFPTDVKHVTHIGWDGSTTTSTMKNWVSNRCEACDTHRMGWVNYD